ncbi:BnaCnng58830D [Brassica napus]|uniref:BnaCnng58830D protein n=1 Tax=Brassica napus TaxID=3708 RepID=A0A078JNQ5_BRANA|nr:BnaCnng58830D [Brassica napus]
MQKTCGKVADDPFVAYQEVAKVMYAKKGSSSRTVSGDEVMITGSRRATVVKLEPSSSLQGKKLKSGGVTTRSVQQSADIARSAGNLATALSNLNLKVFPQDGSVLPIGDPSEVVQVLQGGLLRTVSQLYHLGERLSNEGSMVLREEIEDLKHQVSEEKDQRMAWELEIRDLKDK